MENGEAPGEAVRRANLMENCQGLPRAMGYDWQRAMLMEKNWVTLKARHWEYG